MALIKCRECGKEISSEAEACPNCGCPIKKKNNQEQKPQKQTKKNSGCGCLIGVVIGIFIIIGSIVMYGAMDKGIQSTISGVNNEDEYITLEEYNQIQSGMTYEEVCNIVGSQGTETAKSSSGNYTVSIITWYGNGMAGSNANVTFTNGSVTAKAQVGLK